MVSNQRDGESSIAGFYVSQMLKTRLDPLSSHASKRRSVDRKSARRSSGMLADPWLRAAWTDYRATALQEGRS